MKLDNFFDIETEFNFDKEKELFIENLDMLKSMSVQEQTLYKKWLEFNNNEKTRQRFMKDRNILFPTWRNRTLRH